MCLTILAFFIYHLDWLIIIYTKCNGHLIKFSFFLFFCLPQIWFAFVNGFSGQILFERWCIGLYNVVSINKIFSLKSPVSPLSLCSCSTNLPWCPKSDLFFPRLCHQHPEKFLLYLWPVVKSLFPLCPELCTECERTTASLAPKSVVSKGSHIWMIKRIGRLEQQLSSLLIQGVPQGSIMGPPLMNPYFMSVMNLIEEKNVHLQVWSLILCS